MGAANESKGNTMLTILEFDPNAGLSAVEAAYVHFDECPRVCALFGGTKSAPEVAQAMQDAKIDLKKCVKGVSVIAKDAPKGTKPSGPIMCPWLVGHGNVLIIEIEKLAAATSA